MNAQERELEYPHDEALPEAGQAIEVAPGVRWIRMQLPFALNHINLWLLRDRLDGREGWTIVDCGIANEQTKATWEQVFANLLEGLPVLRVIVTHMHPDHIGLADWLCQRWTTTERECRMWISATDYGTAQLAVGGHFPVGGDRAAAFFHHHGLVDPESLAKVRQRGSHFTTLVPSVPWRYARLLNQKAVSIGGRDWICHAGYGHAPEHMSLHCAEIGVLISGDMVLPRISTNVAVTDMEPEADSLALYLASIERMRAIPADTLVLPSHGRPFRGLHKRIDQLQLHHDDRCAEVLDACAEKPGSATDMLAVLFRRTLDLHQMTFAMGESIAHLNLLWHDGRMTRTVGADGVYRFATTPGARRHLIERG